MIYSKTDLKDFKEIVCPNCSCIEHCIMKAESCPKMHNYALYHTEDGTCPETSELLHNLESEKKYKQFKKKK